VRLVAHPPKHEVRARALEDGPDVGEVLALTVPDRDGLRASVMGSGTRLGLKP
jgi:hypothetical protein